MEKVILKMNQITKSFPGVKALKGVSLELREGEVHALLGENGAGKSTLMKCLAGIYSIDSGTIEYYDKIIELRNPSESMAYGISVIHQELALAEQLTVADNMFMGQEPVNKLGFIDRKKIYGTCNQILSSLNANFTSYCRVFSLSAAQKQMLEIAKAINKNVKILVMDEPTAAVSHKEVEKIFELIRSLKSRGITIVYISHRMDEIFKIADRITVLRDGANVSTVNANDVDRNGLVKMMVGYNLNQFYSKSEKIIGEKIMHVSNLSRSDKKVLNAEFSLNKGEIVGFAGLVGSGRTELMQTIFGITPYSEGLINLNGKNVRFRNPGQALDAGICLVPEDRKSQGLILQNNVKFNLSISILKTFIRLKWFGNNKVLESRIAQHFVEKLSIKVSSLQQKVINLSGGNQQKIVVGKWLAASKNIIILDEPTRGIDVGAKAEIYALMDELISQGKSIIMVSSELQELVNMSDRIYVMRNGQIRHEFNNRKEFDQEEILNYMLGLK